MSTIGMNARARRRLDLGRYLLFAVSAAFFGLPLLALIEFSTRTATLTSPRTFAAWRAIVTDGPMFTAIISSLELAAVTAVAALVLVTPTMIWVRLKLPWFSRVMQFLCLLPLTIPVIALVVGLAPVYQWVTYLPHSISPITLTFAYVIFVLPYIYRALDAGLGAINLKTLSEAARSLGAGWGTVIVRIILPNLAPALLNAGLLSVALVLGEFTAASLLQFPTMPVQMASIQGGNANLAFAVSAASMLFAFVLLLIMTLAGSRRSKSRRTK